MEHGVSRNIHTREFKVKLQSEHECLEHKLIADVNDSTMAVELA